MKVKELNTHKVHEARRVRHIRGWDNRVAIDEPAPKDIKKLIKESEKIVLNQKKVKVSSKIP